MNAFATSRDERRLEDYRPGMVYLCPESCTLDEASIIAFAAEYDRQHFHLDRDAAKGSPYGGLIASGLQTLAVGSRLMVDHYLPTSASFGSPGCDELRWRRPVRPGDTLRARVTVLDVKPSASRPDRGVIMSLLEVLNQAEEVVLSLTIRNIVATRSWPGS